MCTMCDCRLGFKIISTFEPRILAKCFLSFILAIATCSCHEGGLDQKASSACLGLQHLADWLAVVSKITGTLTRSVTSRVVAASEPHLRSKRQVIDVESCSSLKSLRSTAESYVKLQAELLGLKAVLGGGLIQTGKMRLEETSKVLQDRVRHLDALNRTSNEILRRLKAGSEVLSSQVDAVSSRALSFVREVASGQEAGALRQLQGVLDMRQDLEKTRGLLKRGDFFQSIGRVLDRMLLPAPTPKNNVAEEEGF